MKKLYTLLPFIAVSVIVFSQAPYYHWAKKLDGDAGAAAHSIKADASGNVYVTGYFEGTNDFDPSAGSATYTSYGLGFADIFFAKYDANGNHIWSNRVGSISQDQALALALDNNNNIYICGYYRDTTDFDPGAGVAQLVPFDANYASLFFAKYDANGNYVWAKGISSSGDNRAWSICVSDSGYVYLAGSFWGTADFNPGSDTANLISNGYEDIFVAKYDENGNYIWAKSIGSSSSFGDEAKAIATDQNGNVFISGRFSGSADFNPGTAVNTLTASGGYDIFFAKFDAVGNYVWAKKIGNSSAQEYCLALALDQNSQVFIGGSFTGTLDFDPGAGTANLVSAGSGDGYLAKYDNAGDYQWAINLGSAGVADEFIYGLSTDAANNIYATGRFSGTTDFNSGAGIDTLSPVGNWDFYFTKYSSAGNYQWAKGIGGTGGELAWSIYLDASENVYLAGVFESTVDFDPGAGVENLTANIGSDIFIAKYSPVSLKVDNVFSNAVRIFPNPSSGLFQLVAEQPVSKIEVVNLLGQQVFVQQNIGQKNISVNISAEAKGVYIVNIWSGEKVLRNKIVLE